MVSCRGAQEFNAKMRLVKKYESDEKEAYGAWTIFKPSQMQRIENLMVGNRTTKQVAKAIFGREHYVALINIFRNYNRPWENLW